MSQIEYANLIQIRQGDSNSILNRESTPKSDENGGVILRADSACSDHFSDYVEKF